MKLRVFFILAMLVLAACGKKQEEAAQDFTISASPDTDTGQAIPLFKTLTDHCPGIPKYKNDVERIEYLGGASFDLIIKKRPTVIPLDSAPMGHTCHFQVDGSKVSVGKRPCAWLCTGQNMAGIDGEDHSYTKGKLIGPLKREWANLSEAVAGTRFEMGDFSDVNFSRGAANLAIWGAKNMTWADLQKVEQGKYGMVMKDPDSQRGKRLCAYGEIIEIQVDNSVPDKIYFGGLNAYSDDGVRIYRFAATGSTGELVAGSEARFCGVITGKNSYQNSAGGMTHAVHLVGMFELPENKKPSM